MNIPSSNFCLDVLRKKIAFLVFCKYIYCTSDEKLTLLELHNYIKIKDWADYVTLFSFVVCV